MGEPTRLACTWHRVRGDRSPHPAGVLSCRLDRRCGDGLPAAKAAAATQAPADLAALRVSCPRRWGCALSCCACDPRKGQQETASWAWARWRAGWGL